MKIIIEIQESAPGYVTFESKAVGPQNATPLEQSFAIALQQGIAETIEACAQRNGGICTNPGDPRRQ
jgi:hypothetical protein